MATWPGERNGVQGTYLDSPFAPRFFPSTVEGKAALSKQIDFEIKIAWIAGGIVAVPLCALLAYALVV